MGGGAEGRQARTVAGDPRRADMAPRWSAHQEQGYGPQLPSGTAQRYSYLRAVRARPGVAAQGWRKAGVHLR